MARHYAPSIQFKAFIFATKDQRIYDNFKIDLSRKYVYPIYGSKTYEIKFTGIMENIFSAHKTNMSKFLKFFLKIDSELLI
ncbi:hypothetical protein GCM10027284_19530 [Cyclobacterium sediminis]